MNLSDLHPAEGSTRRVKRVGRGIGSGHGKTSGRGHKGKGSRTGGNTPPGYEGGQMPLQRRLPKVGFRSRTAHEVCEVLLYKLDSVAGDVIDFAALRNAGLVETRAVRAKIVKKGEIKRPIKLKGVAATAGARAAIEAAGGSVE